MSALKYIYDKLIAGECFGTIEPHRLGGTYFWDVLWADAEYIHWKHYGSSANKLSLENLKWILTTIFKMTPEQFIFEYTTYKNWSFINTYYGKTSGQC